MFTGIIAASRPIATIEDRAGLRSITVELGPLAEGVQRGASVAIDGVCLTATDIAPVEAGGAVRFDVMQESLLKTTLGRLREGELVHVERSAKFGDEVGGHVVSGHVSGVARVIAVRRPENNHVIRLQLPEKIRKYVFEKGFVALKGASLTVVDLDESEGSFEVWLIPETLEITTFGELEVGDEVNVEVDPQTVTIVETVERVLARREK